MTEPNAPVPASQIVAEMLRTLAATGAICPKCAGLCAASIDIAIVAVTVGRSTGVRIPLCGCFDCVTCGPLNAALERIRRDRENPTRRSDR